MLTRLHAALLGLALLRGPDGERPMTNDFQGNTMSDKSDLHRWADEVAATFRTLK